MDENENPHRYLQSLCRVCGFKLQGNGIRPVKSYLERLVGCYKINKSPEFDVPRKFCDTCYRGMTNYETRNYKCNPKEPVEWSAHKKDCTTCEWILEVKKGGRKKKPKPGPRANKMSQGKPEVNTVTESFDRYLKLAPPDIATQDLDVELFDENLNPNILICKCPICLKVMRRPVVLTACQHMYCVECLITSMSRIRNVALPPNCDVCKKNINIDEGIQPSHLAFSIICSLILQCACGELVRVEELTAHQKQCTCQPVTAGINIHKPTTPLFYHPQKNPTARDILNLVPGRSIPPIVEEVLTHGVHLKMASRPNATYLDLKTDGSQPLRLATIPVPRKNSNEVSIQTVRRRSRVLENITELVSGTIGAVPTQRANQLSRVKGKERQELLEKAGFKVEINAEQVLAIKSDLKVPWNSMRAWSRWLKMFNVQMASEAKSRSLSKKWIGEDLIVEMMPFSFQSGENKNLEVHLAPCAYMEDLKDKIFSYLQQLESADLIKPHEAIPDDEIWIKVGGDHGGNSFKMVFQVGNVESPNSEKNTVVFCIFEAKDLLPNIRSVLQKYKEQIKELESMTWRSKKLRVFVFGDYKLLCQLFGISGASGRHSCLWCEITSLLMNIPLEQRGKSEPRTLETLSRDYERFTQGGSVLNKAKLYNNVIEQTLVDIPLSQVILPGLHISLGLFLRFFNLLEDACHQLDIKIAYQAAQGSKSIGSVDFQNYITKIQEAQKLLGEAKEEQQKASQLEELAAWFVVKGNITEENENLKVLGDTARSWQEKAKEKINQAQKLQENTFSKDKGPCVRKLDETLKEINVARQAYHGKSFIGNHVHKMCKDINIEKLCNSFTEIVAQNAPELEGDALKLRECFSKLFHIFAACHSVYDSSKLLTAADLTQLDDNIKKLLQHYRSSFPQESVPPKMHFLEDHMVDVLTRWKVGLGLLGEQGAESIHNVFNRYQRMHACVKPCNKRLECMMNTHLIGVFPKVQTLKPKIRKRKSQSCEE